MLGFSWQYCQRAKKAKQKIVGLFSTSPNRTSLSLVGPFLKIVPTKVFFLGRLLEARFGTDPFIFYVTCFFEIVCLLYLFLQQKGSNFCKLQKHHGLKRTVKSDQKISVSAQTH